MVEHVLRYSVEMCWLTITVELCGLNFTVRCQIAYLLIQELIWIIVGYIVPEDETLTGSGSSQFLKVLIFIGKILHVHLAEPAVYSMISKGISIYEGMENERGF